MVVLSDVSEKYCEGNSGLSSDQADTPLSVGRAPQVEKHYSNRDKDNPDSGNRFRARFKCDERDQKHGYGA